MPTASPSPASGLDQYGFTIGGPVRVPKVYNGKDRTFFFFAWEKYHEDQEYPSEKVASVPTAAQRSGDFSDTRDNAEPPDHHLRSADRTSRSDRQVGAHAVPGQQDSRRPHQPGGAKILALYPLPNTFSPGPPAWQNNYFCGDNIANFNFTNVMARHRPQLQFEGAGLRAVVDGATSRRSAPRTRFPASAATIATAASTATAA